MIVVGIDPHKRTHTAVAVNQATGEHRGELTVSARQPGDEELMRWARELDAERLFALEAAEPPCVDALLVPVADRVAAGLDDALGRDAEAAMRLGQDLILGQHLHLQVSGCSPT